MRTLFLLVSVVASIGMACAQSVSTTDNGVSVLTGDTKLNIEFYTHGIVRVVKLPANGKYDRQSLSVTLAPQPMKGLKVAKGKDNVTLTSNQLQVKVDTKTLTVDYATTAGTQLLKEQPSKWFTPVNDAGRATYKVTQSFRLEPEEAIFGLGILQNGKMSQRGENRDLCPGNTDDGIPFFQSEKGYGVYWDNYSTIRFADTQEGTSFTSEVGDAVDYYFIYGKTADGVVAAIRQLTGDVPMAPLWSYGFYQSKERYKSQQETVDVLHRYRKDGVPIDCMIQDWQYWGPNYLWNAMEFMNEQFPDPQAMLDDIHRNNAHCMISIWSSFGPETKPYKELAAKGLLFDMATWPQSGISHIWPPRMDYPSGVRVYDCYSPDARDIYWNHLHRLFDFGLDGWWMDSTEPDHFDHTQADFDHQTAMGSYRSVRSAYPLMTVGGVYDHQRNDPAATKDKNAEKRVFILTRSGFFGQQRYAANVWSGDVVSTWDMLRKQVTAGLNFSLTGNPNFNSDLGGFFAGSYNGSWQGKPAYENPAYRELYTRWMQQGIFTPMMRSHGADVPRELYYYGKAGEPVYDAMVSAIKLRYKLLPYIYSTAWQVSKARSTFMRALVMDFANDREAVNSVSEYMFGNAILATPVLQSQYTPEVQRRDRDANAGWDKNTGRTTMTSMENVDFTAKRQHTVYLPKGTKWYYYHNGKQYDGGQQVDIDVTLADAPFFLRAGSILPLGPDVQYSNEKPWDNLTLRVYAGADGQFTLYEDEGDNYNYEQGAYTEIPMTWNDRSRTLTIGRRTGSYPGQLTTRTFTVTLTTANGTTQAKQVNYNGNKITVKL